MSTSSWSNVMSKCQNVIVNAIATKNYTLTTMMVIYVPVKAVNASELTPMKKDHATDMSFENEVKQNNERRECP